MRSPLSYDTPDPAMESDEGRKLPVLDLPKLKDAEVLAWDAAVAKAAGIYGFDSLDARSRPFNMIRAKLHELRAQRGWRLFGIVSATPKVGKSFICANVAASLSRDPRFDTMAIDLDLRRASLTQVFKIEPRTSIRSYLEGDNGSKAPTAYALEGERLTILPTTPGQIRSAELLAGSRRRHVVDLGDRRQRAQHRAEALHVFRGGSVFQVHAHAVRTAPAIGEITEVRHAEQRSGQAQESHGQRGDGDHVQLCVFADAALCAGVDRR